MSHWNTAEVLGFGAEPGTVVSSSKDRTLAIWDLTNGNRKKSISLSPSAFGKWPDWNPGTQRYHSTGEILTPDGKELIESMANGELRVTDLTTEASRTLDHVVDLPIRMAISTDGNRLP